MGTMISLNLVIACCLAALALLCAIIYFGMRRQPAVAWIAGSLICGALTRFLPSATDMVVVSTACSTLLVPAAYLCYGEAVRVTLGHRRQYWPLFGIIAGLLATALVLLALKVPYIYQTLPFQFACALALGQTVFRLWQQDSKTAIDYCLMAAVSGVAVIFLFRIPVYPLILGPELTYDLVRETSVERITLLASAMFTPFSVFLLLAKIISNVIAGYRSRSELDGLTGLLNRRAFDEVAGGISAAAGSMIICDIDHFKQVNDRYGHQTGDAVIASFAALMRETGHCAGRIGGEEFALVLPGHTVEEAAVVAETVRQAFHDNRQPGMAENHKASASFGIATYAAGETPASAMRRADVALYRAKRSGRDRVIAFTIGEGELLRHGRKNRPSQAA